MPLPIPYPIARLLMHHFLHSTMNLRKIYALEFVQAHAVFVEIIDCSNDSLDSYCDAKVHV